MNYRFLLISLILSLSAAFGGPAAAEWGEITQTKCWLNGGKCNIKFRNMTGVSGGSDGGSYLDQRTSAQLIKVKAARDDGNPAGNVLKIDAGASKTMNMDKKYDREFAWIRISSPTLGNVDGVTISCAEVQAILNGNGTCKVFYGIKEKSDDRKYKRQLGYQCDGGNVGGPSND
jgi:hypothetical protein